MIRAPRVAVVEDTAREASAIIPTPGLIAFEREGSALVVTTYDVPLVGAQHVVGAVCEALAQHFDAGAPRGALVPMVLATPVERALACAELMRDAASALRDVAHTPGLSVDERERFHMALALAGAAAEGVAEFARGDDSLPAARPVRRRGLGARLRRWVTGVRS